MAIAVAVVSGCGGLSDDKAVRLVEAYNRKAIEGFRTGDARLVEDVAGPRERKKLTALIGVKLDMGITLDARLLDFKVSGIDRRRDEIVVKTTERWEYRDRRIGTGEQVGEGSVDRYAMHYVLRRPEGRWVVDEIEFATPPQVGRREGPLSIDVKAAHGIETPVPGSSGSSERAGGAPPAPAGGKP